MQGHPKRLEEIELSKLGRSHPPHLVGLPIENFAPVTSIRNLEQPCPVRPTPTVVLEDVRYVEFGNLVANLLAKLPDSRGERRLLTVSSATGDPPGSAVVDLSRTTRNEVARNARFVAMS